MLVKYNIAQKVILFSKYLHLNSNTQCLKPRGKNSRGLKVERDDYRQGGLFCHMPPVFCLHPLQKASSAVSLSLHHQLQYYMCPWGGIFAHSSPHWHFGPNPPTAKVWQIQIDFFVLDYAMAVNISVPHQGICLSPFSFWLFTMSSHDPQQVPVCTLCIYLWMTVHVRLVAISWCP